MGGVGDREPSANAAGPRSLLGGLTSPPPAGQTALGCFPKQGHPPGEAAALWEGSLGPEPGGGLPGPAQQQPPTAPLVPIWPGSAKSRAAGWGHRPPCPAGPTQDSQRGPCGQKRLFLSIAHTHTSEVQSRRRGAARGWAGQGLQGDARRRGRAPASFLQEGHRSRGRAAKPPACWACPWLLTDASSEQTAEFSLSRGGGHFGASP